MSLVSSAEEIQLIMLAPAVWIFRRNNSFGCIRRCHRLQRAAAHRFRGDYFTNRLLTFQVILIPATASRALVQRSL